jgi:hypothetical protein
MKNTALQYYWRCVLLMPHDRQPDQTLRPEAYRPYAYAVAREYHRTSLRLREFNGTYTWIFLALDHLLRVLGLLCHEWLVRWMVSESLESSIVWQWKVFHTREFGRST